VICALKTTEKQALVAYTPKKRRSLVAHTP